MRLTATARRKKFVTVARRLYKNSRWGRFNGRFWALAQKHCVPIFSKVGGLADTVLMNSTITLKETIAKKLKRTKIYVCLYVP